MRSAIPQAPVTARHLRVDYSHYRGVPAPLTNGGLNEHGVAVRDVWSPSSERLGAMTPPDQRGPNYSDLARIVLERARTAREGVELIGQLIDASRRGHLRRQLAPDRRRRRGVGGDRVRGRPGTVGRRADRPRRHPRQPPGRDRAQGAGRLRDRTPTSLGPPHLIEFAVERGWYDPADGPFNANAVYGDGQGRWQGARWMRPAGWTRRRARRIALADVIWAVRTERLTGDSAGYGQVVPLDRPTATPSCACCGTRRSARSRRRSRPSSLASSRSRPSCGATAT